MLLASITWGTTIVPSFVHLSTTGSYGAPPVDYEHPVNRLVVSNLTPHQGYDLVPCEVASIPQLWGGALERVQ